MLKYIAGSIIFMLLAFTTVAQVPPDDITADADLQMARKVKDYYGEWLSSIPGVSTVNVAHNDQGEPEIMINAAQITPQLKQIPRKLNGIPVVVVASRPASGESLFPEPANPRGLMPNPTPQVEISPVPTPEGNRLWPTPLAPIDPNP